MGHISHLQQEQCPQSSSGTWPATLSHCRPAHQKSDYQREIFLLSVVVLDQIWFLSEYLIAFSEFILYSSNVTTFKGLWWVTLRLSWANHAATSRWTISKAPLSDFIDFRSNCLDNDFLTQDSMMRANLTWLHHKGYCCILDWSNYPAVQQTRQWDLSQISGRTRHLPGDQDWKKKLLSFLPMTNLWLWGSHSRKSWMPAAPKYFC